MKNDLTTNEMLAALQKEKGQICISMIIPTHRMSPERRADKPELERAIMDAKDLLQYKYSESNIDSLLQSIDELYTSVNFLHNLEGLGLYVSPNIKFAVKFPFPVSRKVMVEENFEIRDLLYKANLSETYFVLLLSEKGTRLFKGSLDDITEINDENFPQPYREQYEYSKPVRSTSYAGHAHVKSFEKDKSESQATRFRGFFRQTDEMLNEYLEIDTALILLGVRQELAWFAGITSHKNNLIAEISGNYGYAHEKQLADLCWPAMQKQLNIIRKKLVEEFVEMIGNHRAVNGIEEIWKAVKQGKGFKLLVEKDFYSYGFTDKDTDRVFTYPPHKPHHILPDAIDDIIEMTLEKKGQVYFVQNDALKDYQRIALITRY